MKIGNTHLTIASFVLALSAFAGCNEEALRDPLCGDENTFEFDGNEYCVVIEEGFLETECPADFPSGRSFEDFVLCAAGDPVPDEAAEEARRRGFGIPDETCTDGETRPAGDGCNTCTCVDGDFSACTEIACDELTTCLASCPTCESPDEASYVGESPAECSVIDYTCEAGQDSFSNTCGCGCKPGDDPVCEEGEVIDAPDGCNTCTCVDGAFLCTLQPCEITLEACLAGCPECETLEEADYVGESRDECSVIDFQCDPVSSGGSFANECGCGCLAGTETCEPGEVIDAPDGCNTCTCIDGEFACTDRACDPDLEACLAECGVGCPEPQFQLCSIEGESYCNSCEASCYEASISTDREPCECPVLTGEPVTFELLTVAEGCIEADTGFIESAVARSADDILPWFNCDTGIEPFAFDPAAEVIVRAVFFENPDAAVREVVQNGSDITVNMTARQYCGGPAPSNQISYMRIPNVDADTTITVENCRHTACAEFFP